MHQPIEAHWSVALRALDYIKGGLRKGLMYRKHENVCISRYCNSSYAGDRDDSKSTTRYCTFVGDFVTWSKKQDVVSRSSAKTEYKVMAHTACKMVWLKNLLMELDFSQFGLIPIYCDNQSAIHIAQNHVFHEKIKHIKVDCYFVRDA